MKAKTIWFWHRERPVLSDQGLEAIKRVNAAFDVDVAVAACPSNYEQALATVFGGSDALKARIAGAPEEVKAYNKQQEARMQALRDQPAPAKPANALPAVAFAQKGTPLTDAELEESVSDAMVALGENPQTLRDMLSAIAAIEASYDSMPGKRVIALVDERILPTIDPLLAAAWANYPGRKTPRQRMDYAEWEGRFLRPVLQACGKLMAMGQTYSNAGAAAVGSQLGQAMMGRVVPSARDWATMVYDNDKHCRAALDLAFRLYQTRFKADAPLDARYMATIHRKAKFEPPVEWRNADLPSDHIAPKTTTTYFYGTAREVDAAMAQQQMAENALRTAQSFADALAVREQALQQKLHYMQDFWACYKARCADGSKLYVQYLWILDQEDRQRFMPILQTANALMAPTNNFLSSRYTSGLDDVQWLITQLCEPARYGVMQEIRSPKNRSVTTEPLAWWQWLNNTESYAAWRDCRNKVAYAVKP